MPWDQKSQSRKDIRKVSILAWPCSFGLCSMYGDLSSQTPTAPAAATRRECERGKLLKKEQRILGNHGTSWTVPMRKLTGQSQKESSNHKMALQGETKEYIHLSLQQKPGHLVSLFLMLL